MDRRALLVALVAGGAVLAFGVGAATLDDALAATGPEPGDSGDGPAEGGPNVGSSVDDAGAAGGSCADCPAPGLGLTTTGLLPALPRRLVLAAAALGTLVTALLWRRAGRGSGGAVDAADAAGSGVESAADATGSTTVAPEDPPATNPVYRAWRDAFGRIDDGDPETTTPGEYAAAAVERGWDAGSVGTLTALFRQVRYGGREATDERAERARAAADRLSEEGS